MYILGLTTLGDSAATLIKDGEMIAAAEEERFSRKKHHSGFLSKRLNIVWITPELRSKMWRTSGITGSLGFCGTKRCRR